MASSNLETLSEIFNDKTFRIPDYQRGYAWSKNQIDDFWSDLQNLNSDRVHYTGMITVEKKENYFHVIDGQQRLTTIMILIKTILDNFENDDWIDDKEKNDYVKKYLFRKVGKEGKNIKVVFGYEKDNPSDCYFKTKILEIEDSDCYSVANETLYTKNLQFAKDTFIEKIEKLTKDELEQLFKKITKQLKFNFYELDDELDEFVTFETMNNRGKPLTTLELLKNRLIYLTTLLRDYDSGEIETLRKDINNSWKTIYEYLGKNPKKIISDDRFLKDHWIMYFTYDRSVASAEKEFLLSKHFTQQNIFNKHNDTLREIAKRLKKSHKDFYIDYDDIKNYVLNIKKAIIEYYYMENPEQSNYDEEVKKWLSKLNRVGFGAFRPIITAILTERVETEKVKEILQLAENYVFLVFTLSNRKANTGDSRFYRYANKFHTNKNVGKLIENMKSEIFSDDNTYNWVSLDNFETEINEHFKKNEGWYSWKGIKYLLYEYELFLQEEAKGETKLQWEEINKDTIEHIYPQNPKDKCWIEFYLSLNKKEKQRKLHTLGNLVLLSNSKNSSLKNNCFNKIDYDKTNKKDVFSNGSYSEIEVSKNQQWTPLEIDKRSKKILQFLSDRWDLFIEEDTMDKLI
jgi:uncharacterized protein with ParB-like and HNH nuclease domain